MSTFTRLLGHTDFTCDRCQQPAGTTWRQRAGHVCPDTRPPRPERPRCETETCAQPLVRRIGEGLNDYTKRRFCNRSCASTHSNRERAS